MKKYIRLLAASLALLVLLAMTVSCGNESLSARERLSSLLALFGNAPAGACYATLPSDGDSTLDERLIAALYVRADGYLEYEGRVSECALYLGSAGDPFFEAAVFVCYGNADTRAVVEMCLRRARLVSSVHAIAEGDIVLTVSGRTVCYMITPRTSAARDAMDHCF